jgi:hypothetical protein
MRIWFRARLGINRRAKVDIGRPSTWLTRTFAYRRTFDDAAVASDAKQENGGLAYLSSIR